jgi:hypothetical protein
LAAQCFEIVFSDKIDGCIEGIHTESSSNVEIRR